MMFVDMFAKCTLAVTLGACFAPDIPTGVLCGAGGACPAGQQCIDVGGVPRCELPGPIDASDPVGRTCATHVDLSTMRSTQVVGVTFPGSSPSEAVDGVIGAVGGYWACMQSCSLIVDLGVDAIVERLHVWPGGNRLPSIFYLQRAWRVQFARAAAPSVFADFEGVVREAGEGAGDAGVSVVDGWPPGYPAASAMRYPAYEQYRFRVDPTIARYIRFDGISGDVDNDTNVDELAVFGCTQ